MYKINFTGTGSATLDNFTESQQQQILYVLNNVAANYDEKSTDNSQIRYLGNGFHVVRVNATIRVGIKIQKNTFDVIDVKSENLAIA
jgi:hypothetical protein